LLDEHPQMRFVVDDEDFRFHGFSFKLK